MRNGPQSCSDAGGRYWDRTSDLFRVREARYRCANRPGVSPGHNKLHLSYEVEMGFEPTYTALQAAASPLGHSTLRPQSRAALGRSGCLPRADDGIRTRDPHLGKVMLYH